MLAARNPQWVSARRVATALRSTLQSKYPRSVPLTAIPSRTFNSRPDQVTSGSKTEVREDGVQSGGNFDGKKGGGAERDLRILQPVTGQGQHHAAPALEALGLSMFDQPGHRRGGRRLHEHA